MALPYIPIKIDDYLKDTRLLTTEEHGAYLLLIFHYWQTERPLDDRDDKLAKIVGVSRKKWKNLKKNLKTYFRVEDDIWSHSRIEFDLEKAIGKQKKASHAAKEGVRKRMNEKLERERLERMESERPASAEQTQSNTDTDTDTDTKTTKSAIPSPTKEVVDLCNLLSERVHFNLQAKSKNPEKVKRPEVSKAWLTQMDLLIRKDGHSPDEVREVIEWSQSDEFWASNVMSPAKLRAQFDRLILKMPSGADRSKTIPHAMTIDPLTGEKYCRSCGSAWPCLTYTKRNEVGF